MSTNLIPTIKIICGPDSIEGKTLTQTDSKISGGHRSDWERNIYECEGKKWCIKNDNLVNEYLGAAASRLLGLNIPDYAVGLFSDKEGSKTQVFVQEYLAHDKGKKPENYSTQKAHLIAVATFLGDSDTNGIARDNLFLSEEKLYRIDYGCAFRNLACPGYVSAELKNNSELKKQIETNFKESFSNEFRKIYDKYVCAVASSEAEGVSLNTFAKLDNLGLNRITDIDSLINALLKELESLKTPK